MAHSEVMWEGTREEVEEMRGMMPPDTPKKGYTQEEMDAILRGDNWKSRGSALDEAKKIINGERQDQYGNPEDNFQVIADLWKTYAGRHFSARDVAIMMALLKIARIRSGSGTRDSYVDCLGYIALAADMEQK